MKRCTKCGAEKSFDLFYRQAGKPTSWCKACNDAANRARYERNREARNRQIALVRRARQLGMTPEEYKALPEDPGRACAICGASPTDRRNGHWSNGKKSGRRNLAIDHEHASGQTRGFLCQCCNHALGLADDDPVLLRKMADYLEHGAGFPTLGSYSPRPTICMVAGCGDHARSRGLCGMHYARLRKTGMTNLKPSRVCIVDGCGRKHYGEDYCRRHWWHWKQHGDPRAGVWRVEELLRA